MYIQVYFCNEEIKKHMTMVITNGLAHCCINVAIQLIYHSNNNKKAFFSIRFGSVTWIIRHHIFLLSLNLSRWFDLIVFLSLILPSTIRLCNLNERCEFVEFSKENCFPSGLGVQQNVYTKLELLQKLHPQKVTRNMKLEHVGQVLQ